MVAASIEEECLEIRELVIDSLVQCGGGHFGGALSVTDILWVLYKKILLLDANNPDDRDRLILSKGHACIALYAVLSKLGFFKRELLNQYGRFNSILEGHPDMRKTPGIDFSSGSLGQGLSVGIGIAMGLKPIDRDVWVVLGDGECQEGQIWEAAQFADRYKLGNLKAVVDCNRYQEFGWHLQEDVYQDPIPNLRGKLESFGWKVMIVDGHNHQALEETFLSAKNYRNGPCVVLAQTIKGKGYELIENDPIRFHCGELTTEEYDSLLKDRHKR
jgi:transketolase